MKTKIKKWPACLLAAVLMLTMMPSTVFAAGITEYDDIYTMFGLISYMDSSEPYFYSSEQVSDSVAHSYATSGGGSRFADYYDENTQRYTMTYDQYIAVIDSLFVNHSDMKTYLSETPGYYVPNEDGTSTPVNCYDPDTNSVSFVTGGAGSPWAFEVLNAYTIYDNHIYVEGIYVECSENITDGEPYVDYYPVSQPDGSVINGRIVAQPRLGLQNVDGSLKIESYENIGFHVVDDVMYKDGSKGYRITTEYYEYDPETGKSVLSDGTGVYFDSSGGKFSNRVWYGDTVWLDITSDRYANPGAAPDFDILKVTYGATGANDAAYSELSVVETIGSNGDPIPHHRGDAIQVTSPMTIKIYKQHVHTYNTEWLSDNTNHWHVCSICDTKPDVAAHTYSAWTITKAATETTAGERSRTCTVCDYTAVESIPAIGEQPAIVTPESDLEERILIAENVTEDQKTALNTAVGGDYKSQFNGKTLWMLDVNLIDIATWETVHDEKVTFTVDYPAGITAENYTEYDFAVLHQKEDGSIESANFQATKDGLKITSTLSPFVIGYSLKSDSSNTDSTIDPSEKPNPTPDPTESPKDNINTDIPQTGDENSFILRLALLLLGGAGLAGAAICSIKKKCNK